MLKGKCFARGHSEQWGRAQVWVVGAPSAAGSGPGKMGTSPGETREGALPLLCPAPASCRPHLGQSCEEAGAAGRAAADRGEGIAEEQAAGGQGVQVRGGDGTVVVGATLKASVIG